MSKSRKLFTKKFFFEELSFFLASPALAWQLFFLIIPLLIIFYYSIISTKDGFTFTTEYFSFFFKHNYLGVLIRTILSAFAVSFLCLILAFPVAYFLATQIGNRFKNIFLFFFTLPFWTNFLILVYSWFFLLDRYGLINSVLMKLGLVKDPSLLANNMIAVILVMVYCYIPFMLLSLYSAMGKITQDVIEASLDLGASWMQTFRFVIIPLSWSGIKTGFLLVFVPAFGEFAIPSLIGGAKNLFVGSLMTHYFLIMHDPSFGSAFTIISLVLLFCIIGLLYLMFEYTKKYKKGTL